MSTACNRECGTPLDLTQPHVTVVRHVEQENRRGSQVTVVDGAEAAVFHIECAPTVDDLLAGLAAVGYVPSGEAVQ